MRHITTDWHNVLTVLSVKNVQMLLSLRMYIYADLQVSDMCLVSGGRRHLMLLESFICYLDCFPVNILYIENEAKFKLCLTRFHTI